MEMNKHAYYISGRHKRLLNVLSTSITCLIVCMFVTEYIQRWTKLLVSNLRFRKMLKIHKKYKDNRGKFDLKNVTYSFL